MTSGPPQLVEYSAWFFAGGSYVRMDVGEAGESWRAPRSIWDDYPELSFGPLFEPIDSFGVHDVLQVTDTVVKIEGRFLDVRRGCLVPPPPRARWAEPGVGVDGYMWERGCALAVGPTVLAVDRVHGAWTVHVPTGTWTGSFGAPLNMDLFTSIILPSLASASDRHPLQLHPGSPSSPGDPGQIRIFDLATAEGFGQQATTDRFLGLAAFNGQVDCAGVAYGDFDRPARARHTRGCPTAFSPS